MGSPREERGFTLIELLVVIVILGILSAIVVFAVRGAGDKGGRAAIDTDARTIRTAEEAFCAKFGHYAEMGTANREPGTLVGERFLSEPSTYNSVATTVPGPCNNTGFTLTSTPPKSTTTSTTIPPSPFCLSGTWCPAAAPHGTVRVYSPEGMVQLLSGKVLALQNPDAPSPGHQYGDGLKTEIFDPSSASGSWSPGPLAPEDQEGDVPTVNTTVLIQGTPAECAPRCGDVLVGLLGVPGQWDLYDPTPAPAGTFTPLPHANHEYRTRDAYARAVQITGTAAQCGANCGKVLIVGGSESGQQITYAELYDPKANTFAVSGQYNPALADAILVRLTDGRVLSVSSRAQMFDPRDGKFSDAATPNFNHDGTYNEGLMLGNGDVLFTGYDDMGLQSVEVYSPSHDTWTEVPSCLPLVECHLYGTLPNGQALARSQGGLSSGRTGGAATTFLFDPNRRVWTPTGQLADAKAGYAAVLLSRGACAPNCNRVLAAGAADVPAEMYTP